jgi:predicted ribosome quality control (RQC) complex YloA/Tae2 family protein
MSSKGKPYRTVAIDGWEVLVGRGADDNDYLTFEVADPGDLWMHVGDTPGSHVVVRNPAGGEVPKEVVSKAAQLTAWYSKARGARTVQVDYCSVADVSKAKRAPAGEVELRRFRSIKVQPSRLEPDD